jgi:hypothetical protein
MERGILDTRLLVMVVQLQAPVLELAKSMLTASFFVRLFGLLLVENPAAT